MAVFQNLTVTEIAGSEDVSKNSSKVRIVWTSTQNEGSYNNFTNTAHYYVRVDDGAETQYDVLYTLPYGSTKTIVDVTLEIPHNDAGSGTVYVRTWMDTEISAGIVQMSQSAELSQIRRGFVILSAPAFDNQTAPSVRFAQYLDSDMVQSLQACISTDGSTPLLPYETISLPAQSYTFAWGASQMGVLLQNTPGDRTVVYILLKTVRKDGSSFVDTEGTEFRVLESAKTKPTITSVTAEPVMEDGSEMPLFVQGNTCAKVQVEASAYTGATISKYTVKVAGKNYAGASVQTALLQGYGDQDVSVEVTDSRGFTSTKNISIFVSAYQPPKIIPATGESTVRVYRSDLEGTVNLASSRCWIKAGRRYSKLEKDGTQYNYCTLYAQVRTGTGNYGSSYFLLSGAVATDSFSNYLRETIDPTVKATVKLTVEDSFGYTDSMEIPLQNASRDLHLGGNCIGIGKNADKTKPKSVVIAEDWEVYKGDKRLLDLMHPIGIIIWLEIGYDPNTTIGGVWENIDRGDFVGTQCFAWLRTE